MIRVLHQNVQCLSNKISELKVILVEYNIDVLVLGEHWQSYAQLQEISFSNYCLVSAFCRDMCHHGGAAIYIRTALRCVERADIKQLSIRNIIECCAIEVRAETNVIIIGFYRPSGSVFSLFLKTLYAIVDRLETEGKLLVICGDFNVNFLKDSACKRELLDLFNCYNLHITIDVPTRADNCLDNIVVNLPLSDCSASCIDFNLSDHSAQLISVNLNLSVTAPYTSYRRSICVNTLNKFHDLLSDESWVSVRECDCPDEAFSSFLGIYAYCIDVCFPCVRYTKKSVKNELNWVTPEVVECRDRLLFLKDMGTQYPIFNSCYINYRNFYKEFIELKQKQVISEYLANSNNISKSAWNIINNERSNLINKQFLPDRYHDVQDMCNAFNKHFSSLVEKLFNNSFSTSVVDFDKIDSFIQPCPQTFFFAPIDEQEIVNIVNNLNSSAAPGDDNINCALLKNSLEPTKAILTYLINFSLQRGVFPSKLKNALIKPIFKGGGSVNDLNNYRPISLLSVFSKVYESAFNKRLVNYLFKFNLFSSCQHGFLPGRNTDSALYSLLQEIYSCLDKRIPCIGLSLDMTKAFDSVNHEILLHKLNRYGIRGVCNEWCRSFLSDRTQVVFCDNFKSDKQRVDTGIPQGSILGPTLFLIYINDLPNCLETSNLVMYADDVNLIHFAPTVPDLLQRVKSNFDLIHSWTQTNMLLLNGQKTAYVLFHNRIEYDIGNIDFNTGDVSGSKSIKILGIVMDEHLKWAHHIEYVSSTLARVCFALKNLRRTCDIFVLKTFYYAKFFSLMKYGVIHWGSASDVSRVFILQKRALRIIYNLPFQKSCKNIFKHYSFLTFYDVYILEVICFVYRHINDFSHSNSHNYDTRNTEYLLPPTHKQSLFQKSLYFIGCKLYNKLPKKIKDINQFSKFKTSVKEILLGINSYSIDDFLNSM